MRRIFTPDVSVGETLGSKKSSKVTLVSRNSVYIVPYSDYAEYVNLQAA